MRQNEFPSWLSNFADDNYKKVEAAYFDSLKRLIEDKSKKTFATVDDALDDFCKRMNMNRPTTAALKASIQASLTREALDKEKIDEMLRQGFPDIAILNECCETPEERTAVSEYVEGAKEEVQREKSEIAHETIKMEDQRPTGPVMPKMSSLQIKAAFEFGGTEEEYKRASRFVKIDFTGDKPIIRVYKVGSMIMSSDRLRNELYVNLKGALLGDIGRVLLQQYMKRYQEGATGLEAESFDVTYQKMYGEAANYLERILRYGIENVNLDEIGVLLNQLVDFESDPALKVSLEKGRQLIDNLQKATIPEEQQKILDELEIIYADIASQKQEIAKQIRLKLPLPGMKDVKHFQFYLMLDKKRRVEVLTILNKQLHLPETGPQHHTGFDINRKPALILVFNPRDNFPYLDKEGYPTGKLQEGGRTNPNKGNVIDVSQYATPALKNRVKEYLKDYLVTQTKRVLIQGGTLTYIKNPDGSETPISVADLPETETIDLAEKQAPKGLIKQPLKSSLSLYAEMIADVVYVDSKGNVFTSEEELLKANESTIEDALGYELLSKLDDELVEDLSADVEVEEFEELSLAAGIRERIVKVANEIMKEAKDEGEQLLQIAMGMKNNASSN